MKLRIRTTQQAPSKTLRVVTAPIRARSRPIRVLDFDIENRPLSYLGSDFTTGEVTAISWAWVDRPENVTVLLLGEADLPDILRMFVKEYEQADLVIGHFIRGHDLPMVNGALVEFQMPPLPDKWTHDTKIDFIRTKGISLSQESLGAMFRLKEQKIQMNQAKWRAANRLTPEGLAYVRERVAGDVKQHMAIWRQARLLNYLGPQKLWRSGSAQSEQYTP